MGNKFLTNNILNLYNYILVKKKIKEIFDLFDYLDRVCNDFEFPTITSNGNIRYEQFLPGITSSKVESFVLNKLCIELRGSDFKRRKLLSKIKMALDTLNKDEKLVFKYSYYDNKEIDYISDKLHFCDKKIKIIKKSASIKFLIALNIDNQCYEGGDEIRVQAYFQDKAREFV